MLRAESFSANGKWLRGLGLSNFALDKKSGLRDGGTQGPRTQGLTEMGPGLEKGVLKVGGEMVQISRYEQGAKSEV